MFILHQARLSFPVYLACWSLLFDTVAIIIALRCHLPDIDHVNAAPIGSSGSWIRHRTLSHLAIPAISPFNTKFPPMFIKSTPPYLHSRCMLFVLTDFGGCLQIRAQQMPIMET